MEEEVRTKRCTKCGLIKPLSEFHNKKSSKDGKHHNCKLCRNEYNRVYDSKNPEKTKFSKLLYLATHPDRRRETCKASYKNNKPTIKIQTLARRKNNPENEILKSAKARAKKRNVTFSIGIEDINTPQYCPIFNIPLTMQVGKAEDNSPSLDRIDSSLGYVKGNVAVISRKANVIKNDGTADEHRKVADWMEKPRILPTQPQILSPLHLKWIWQNAKQRATRKKIPFSIKEENIFVPEICPIFGIPILRGKEKFCENPPSLDQIQVGVGYVSENVAVISYRANQIKNNGTPQEHRKIADWMDSNLLEKAA